MASALRATASNLLAMASNLVSNLVEEQFRMLPKMVSSSRCQQLLPRHGYFIHSGDPSHQDPFHSSVEVKERPKWPILDLSSLSFFVVSNSDGLPPSSNRLQPSLELQYPKDFEFAPCLASCCVERFRGSPFPTDMPDLGGARKYSLECQFTGTARTWRNVSFFRSNGLLY